MKHLRTSLRGDSGDESKAFIGPRPSGEIATLAPADRGRVHPTACAVGSRVVRSRSLPAVLSNRARIVLSGADGKANNAIAAERLKLNKATLGNWRARFIERRLPGPYDDVHPGKPRTIDDERVAQLVTTTLHTKPANGSTHFTACWTSNSSSPRSTAEV